MKRIVGILLLVVTTVMCAIPVITRGSTPEWVIWEEKKCDVEGGSFLLKKGKLWLQSDDGTVTWQIEKKNKVQDIFLTDLDKDGDKELVALVWKVGKYGRNKPFWVTEDEDSISQHLFIYDVGDVNARPDPKWFTSDNGRLIRRMNTDVKDSSVIVVEDLEGNSTLWRWESFGLKNVDNGVTFISFGDNLIHESIYECAGREHDGTFDYLYEPYLEEIKEADIAAVNGETVLVSDDGLISGYPQFGSPEEVGEALVSAGFDIVSGANNHILDKGIAALDFTRAFYQNKGVLCPGIQDSTDTQYKPYELISRNGITFAIFSFTYDTNVGRPSDKYPNMIHYLPRTAGEEEKVLEDLQECRNKADFVVVFAHWGNEYELHKSPEQELWAELFAKGGCDVIIGTHPHVVQETETIERPDGGRMIVYYSLGNFVAEQKWNKDTLVGAEARFVVEHTCEGIQLKDYETKLWEH